MSSYSEWRKYQFQINLEREKLKRRESLKNECFSKTCSTPNLNQHEPSRLSKAVGYLFSIDNVITSKYSRTNEWEPQKFCTPLVVFIIIFSLFSGFLWALRSLIIPHHLAEFHIVTNNSKCLVFSKLMNNYTHIPYDNLTFGIQTKLDSYCGGFLIDNYKCKENGFLIDFKRYELDENLFGERLIYSQHYYEWSGWNWIRQPENSNCNIWAIEHDTKINFKTTKIEKTRINSKKFLAQAGKNSKNPEHAEMSENSLVSQQIWHMIPAESWEFLTKYDIHSAVTAIFDNEECMKLLPMKRYEQLIQKSQHFIYHGKNKTFDDAIVQQFKIFEDRTCGIGFIKIGAIRHGNIYVFDIKMDNPDKIQNGDEVILVPNKAGSVTQCWYFATDDIPVKRPARSIHNKFRSKLEEKEHDGHNIGRSLTSKFAIHTKVIASKYDCWKSDNCGLIMWNFIDSDEQLFYDDRYAT